VEEDCSIGYHMMHGGTECGAFCVVTKLGDLSSPMKIYARTGKKAA